MLCIYCSSHLTVKNGHDKRGSQRYKCNDCKKRFCEKGIFARHRFPKEVIINAISLISFPLSTRNVKTILKKIEHIRVSHVTIYNWLIKFVPHLIKISFSKLITFTKIWHVDEKFIHVRGSKDPHAYLWIVSDSNSKIMSAFTEMKQVQELYYKRQKIGLVLVQSFLSATAYKDTKEHVRKHLEEKRDMLLPISKQLELFIIEN